MKYYKSKHLQINKDKKGRSYAYHSLLGNFTQLSDNQLLIFDRIDKEENIDGLESDIKILLDKNFIYDSKNVDEYELIKPIIHKYLKEVQTGESITKLLLYVTGNCMLKCSYCYLNDAEAMATTTNTLNCSRNNMTWDIAKNAIDKFHDIVYKFNQKKVHVRFMGGEPFMNFPIIKKSIEYINETFKDIEVVFHCNTNGVALTDEMIKFWIIEGNKGIHSTDIEISIDGPKDCHDEFRVYANGMGTFDKCLETLKKFIEFGCPKERIDIACTLNKMNYDKLRELIDMAHSIGLTLIEINTLIFDSPMDILDDVEKRVNALIDARIYASKKGIKVTGKWFKLFERLNAPVLNYCGRIGQQFSIDLDGNVFPCTGYFKNLGHINNWEKIIKDDVYVGLASRVVGKLEECKDCSIECVCAGGCPASAESSYGSFYAREDKECNFRKLMVKKLIYNIDEIKNIEVDDVDSSYVPTLSKYKK